MKSLVLIIFLIVSVSTANAYHKQLDSLLHVLDKAIQDKNIYAAKKEGAIDSLKTRLHESSDVKDQIAITKEICLHYIVFMTDSALLYTRKLEKYALQANDYEEYIDSELFRVRILKTMGLLKESTDILNNVDTLRISEDLKTFYLYTKMSVYNLLIKTSENNDEKKRYQTITASLRNRLVSEETLSPMDYIYVNTERLIQQEKQYDQALRDLRDAYANLDPEEREAAILAYSIAKVYEEKGDTDKAIEYLARSAIADIKNGVKEYMSLRRLAAVLFEYGDVNRAYSYMKCSMQDAIFYNARLRTLESSEMFDFIDKAYQKKEDQRQILLLTILVIIGVLLTFIFFTLLYVYKQKKRLSITKDELSRSNKLLMESNQSLSDSNILKEEYIGLYIGHFSDYLSKIEQFRLKAQKIAKTQGEQALLKFIDLSLDPKDNLEEFYKNFDETILRLFPNFVEEINKLLLKEERISFKANSNLTPDLRIFALIRLGITDSIKIAYFLRYSVSTIYNYRTKMRNKAAGNRDEFEGLVMKIGIDKDIT
ncbi:DUF6377 domain-containing protein [Sphingobacterium corticibacterium]|uniref:Tetratricopeptide repeat protein n=1 Tax=Sphingobacterium corticibacterium TaxID=2484746 RepID=A0A4V2DCF3_9SPHI|nr:DUF6377 domain-containing protein [Sphingobacterium corticibacterium]RZF61288.1 tetratricopeptide repeat protein [Sphingobacterium corticibacterium]